MSSVALSVRSSLLERLNKLSADELTKLFFLVNGAQVFDHPQAPPQHRAILLINYVESKTGPGIGYLAGILDEISRGSMLNQYLDRHSELVNLKFEQGLANEEQQELENIRHWLDEYYDASNATYLQVAQTRERI